VPREQSPLDRLQSSLQMPSALPPTDTRLNISGCVDYLICSVQAAAHDEHVREAKQLLAEAIEAYLDEVTGRVARPNDRG
jgi:hypothetical protein